MNVELPDELVERWLKGLGRINDDEMIIIAMYHAVGKTCGLETCNCTERSE